jgi:hypothetical protein
MERQTGTAISKIVNKTFNIFPAVILILFISFSQSACNSAHDTPEALANSYIDAFKENKLGKFQSLIINASDIKEISKQGVHEADKAEQLAASIKKDASDYFLEFRKEATQDGLDWNNVKISNVTVDEQDKDRIKNYEISIYLQSGKDTYLLILDDTIRTSRGLVITDEPDWGGRQD